MLLLLRNTNATTAVLAATDTKDVASISETGRTTATLTATEAKDVAAISETGKTTGTLSATESKDRASISETGKTTATLNATEAKDVAAISETGKVTATLTATEAKDTANVSETGKTTAALSATEPKDRASISETGKTTATLAAIEAKDTALITAPVLSVVAPTASISSGGLAGLAGHRRSTRKKPHVAFVMASEAPDQAQFELTVHPLPSAKAKARLVLPPPVQVAPPPTVVRPFFKLGVITPPVVRTATLHTSEAPDQASISAELQKTLFDFIAVDNDFLLMAA